MDDGRACIPAHPQGEVERSDGDGALAERGKAVETFGGKVFVRWDPDAEVTAFAPVAYFIEFLKKRECSAQARHPGNDLSERAGRAQAIRARDDDPQR